MMSYFLCIDKSNIYFSGCRDAKAQLQELFKIEKLKGQVGIA